MRLLIIVIALLASASLYGQHIATDNIVWSVDHLRDSASAESMPFVCEFKVYPGENKIEWIQQQGDYVTTFQIRDTELDWTDINQDGMVEYKVRYQGKSGFFRIERSATFFRIQLFVMEGNKNLLPFTLHIANFSAL